MSYGFGRDLLACVQGLNGVQTKKGRVRWGFDDSWISTECRLF